ncbi:hypothetical protein RO3G_14207 [Rhizopus delemar RA 99-880]|uniref:RNase H type-1 domain-containing protein n=1 Tax=Rhizopus delemar (strain RA 99-880 / ATCC MYA-4621 / FGSC 9543 / NRRL 43880) TaxID=246409 RepID=I1CM16_RHIO9|nr:hypothetical protein RO3G_14207 [Rhizopus delemar RA 99-880]|eukprot:EIE89496.1 hypothetical protein RO3G_14207 [Rhizopus delemar RA 99-880]
MNNIEHNDNVAQDQQSINLTPEQLETLFQQFAARLKTEEKGRGERTILPYQIMAEMDETPSSEMRTTIKKYARDVPLYEGELTKSLRMNGYKNWEGPCVLSTHSLQDLQWWEKWLTINNGLPIHLTPPKSLTPTLTIHVDASNTGWGVKSNVMETSGFWTEEEKETSINVRELQTIYFALKLHARNAKNSTIHIFSDNKTALKYSYSGNQEYTSRPIESTSNSALRMETTKEMVQKNCSQMGSSFNRCICDETKQASENILELDAGSGGSGDKCIQSDLAFERSISKPTLEINTQGIASLQETGNTRSSTGNTTMDGSILVPNGTTDDEGTTNSNETKQEVVSSRLEAIQKGQRKLTTWVGNAGKDGVILKYLQ